MSSVYSRIEPTPREHGAFFEEVFERLARYSGLLPTKVALTAKILWRGKVQLQRSDLDFRIITRDGRVGYFDCKSFAGDFFTYSDIESHQIERAVLYNEWNVAAGFIVFFRKSNRVAFFSGQTIDEAGPRSRFTISEGVDLGKLENLNLKRLFGN